MFKPKLFNKKIFCEKIKIKHGVDIHPRDIQNLYLSVGWQYRATQDIITSMNNSVLVTSAWNNDILVGIARATGDGIFNATIWDVAVRPSYQKQGIGKLIIKSMLTKLDDYGIPLITLYVDWAKKDFYSKLGFEANLNKVLGMYKYNLKHRDKKKQEE